MIATIETIAVALFSLMFLGVGVYAMSAGDAAMGVLGLVLAAVWAKANKHG